MSDRSTSPPEGENSTPSDQNSADKAADQRPKTSRGDSRQNREDAAAASRTDSSTTANPVEVETSLRLWLPHDDNLIARGYNNSDKNTSRRSLGSATDRVAEQRRVFGPWLKPDPIRQKRLVDRLAPHKRPAPPDPKFMTWVNHFQYYENIGIDFPKTRKSSAHQRSRDGSVDGSSYHSDGVNLRNTTQYHRLLKRPRTTGGSLGRGGNSSSGSDNNMSDGNNVDQLPDARQSHSASSTSTGRSSKASSVVSGLDRRYMGLQSVNGEQLSHIVHRLTKMTSAYNAKFAPNPHVWIDTSPGKHMVRGGAPPLA